MVSIMGEMGEIYGIMKQRDRERKARNLAAFDPKGWTKHTDYHYSCTVAGKRLDYWPSRNKFQYDGRVMVGDVIGFIKNREQERKD
jgi:hypothetical protein